MRPGFESQARTSLHLGNAGKLRTRLGPQLPAPTTPMPIDDLSSDVLVSVLQCQRSDGISAIRQLRASAATVWARTMPWLLAAWPALKDRHTRLTGKEMTRAVLQPVHSGATYSGALSGQERHFLLVSPVVYRKGDGKRAGLWKEGREQSKAWTDEPSVECKRARDADCT